MSEAFEVLPDLAVQSLGGGVVATNDEFFELADHLVLAAAPTFHPRTFGLKGQVYDGWETRRRREPGHDWAIVRLGAAGIVHGVIVDTAFFTGNYPPFASVEACTVDGYPSPSELAAANWITIVPRSPLKGDARNAFVVDAPYRFTHIRLSIFPDGGVARLRVHGEAVPDPHLLPDGVLDLAAMEHGARVVACSDMFYGSPMNLLLPGLARVMGEGWETARRRDAGNDWITVRLATAGRPLLAELDTSHFKGNAPAAATVRGVDARSADQAQESAWFEVLPRVRLMPDTRHRFVIPLAPPVTHVRLDVYPDGGMARFRLWGRLDPAEVGRIAERWSTLAPPSPTG